MVRISVVIPCYNESENLPALFEGIKTFQQDKDVEFILVENGSIDNSRELMREYAKGNPNVKIVEIDVNQGYGYGIKQGIKESHGDFIAWTHADSQIDIHEISKAKAALSKAEWSQDVFYKGIRNPKDRTWMERMLTSLMGFWVSKILRKKMRDINGQPNVYPQKIKALLLNSPNDVLIEVYCYYEALTHNLTEKRSFVTMNSRLYGKSRLLPNFKSKIRASINVIKYVWALRKRDV